MVKKIPIFLLSIFSSLFTLSAQGTQINSILEAIEKNNQELKTLQLEHLAQKKDLKKLNNLNDPVVSAFYMPFASHIDVTYTEYQVDQTFEFPTVYSKRKEIIDQKSKLLNLQYQEKRQEILREAKSIVLEVIYTNKALLEINKHLKWAETFMNKTEEKNSSLIDLNKTKLMYLQEQFQIQNKESGKKLLLKKLKSLNGGKPVQIEMEKYPATLVTANLDSLWNGRLKLDARLLSLEQKELIAAQKIALSKNETLPNLGIGYNSQGLPNEHFGGVYASVSLPLFESQNQVKSAKLDFDYEMSAVQRIKSENYAELESEVESYLNSLDIYRQYQSNLESLNGEGVLLDAYEKETLSIEEYYAEMDFYRKARRSLLRMEYNLQLLLNNLTFHEL